MAVYEYKVVPAPEKGLKGKGVKGPRERFANALQSVMNELGAEGWEYLRADTLPCEERSGLTGSTTTYQNMLVFRRVVAASEAPQPKALPAPEATPAAETAAEAAPSRASEKAVPSIVPERGAAATDQAAAAAAAAALTAYRESTSGAPKLGPATGRGQKSD
ncbi:DUF4177 domain-containing protein [Aliiruegeria sabulilitoris]|uniref:DUF4177 domain-containing protein n=1 Tax=Aliiruegeria sabulilitoris TaxID=1510458 RepID=UPI0009E7EC6C|nr:DUF4177 domain-containing protein [Aliiruegeria sabulilitoris]NDR56546.1 DUF4177 domain-containing protein [Pseudoruegeria sp. M32A2M]